MIQEHTEIRGVEFFTTRATFQSAFHGRVSSMVFRGEKFLGAVSISRPKALVLHNMRYFAANPTTSLMMDPSPNSSNRRPIIQLLGMDFEH